MSEEINSGPGQDDAFLEMGAIADDLEDFIDHHNVPAGIILGGDSVLRHIVKRIREARKCPEVSRSNRDVEEIIAGFENILSRHYCRKEEGCAKCHYRFQIAEYRRRSKAGAHKNGPPGERAPLVGFPYECTTESGESFTPTLMDFENRQAWQQVGQASGNGRWHSFDELTIVSTGVPIEDRPGGEAGKWAVLGKALWVDIAFTALVKGGWWHNSQGRLTAHFGSSGSVRYEDFKTVSEALAFVLDHAKREQSRKRS